MKQTKNCRESFTGTMEACLMAEERCPDCGETFRTLDDLNEHRVAANHPALPEDQKFPCERCDFVMESREEFSRHMEMAHGAASSSPPSDRR
jgi:uncharacterized C2H2 Zn-finger protein